MCNNNKERLEIFILLLLIYIFLLLLKIFVEFFSIVNSTPTFFFFEYLILNIIRSTNYYYAIL